ncbi:MAG TPA: DUF5666 domain-containing protein [Terriglobales bacterium]|nr:DUF5666 domain-containing protein [Terriglobales bacterium]
MGRFLIVAMLSTVAIAQQPSSGNSNPQDAGNQIASKLEALITFLPDLPAMPRGKSTVIGGAIREVDGVRDQLTLNIFGGRSMRVLFDERTQVYRDGVKASLRDLRAGDHVSVETVLDGTTVFARSIHMLSQLPEGECQGQVISYDRSKGELEVRDSLSPEPIKLHVSSATTIVRQGQESSSGDLRAGTLISIQFQSDNTGQNVVRKIAVLAAPGSAFVFSGNVAFLDLHRGLMVLVDPDDRHYEISFDPDRFVMSRDVHEGSAVTVTASFDGSRYSASAVTLNPQASK